MYIDVGMANCEKRPKQERDDIRFTHIAIPTSFYPSPPRGPTQYPHADYLSIHHHPRNPQTDSIIRSNSTIAPHACTNTIIQSPCSVTIVMAPSSQSNNQKSKNSKAMLQPNNQLQHHSPTCNYPTHHNRLLLSHLFLHLKNTLRV